MKRPRAWAHLEGTEEWRDYRNYRIRKPEGLDPWSAIQAQGRPAMYPPLLKGLSFREIVAAIDEACDLVESVTIERGEEGREATWVIECPSFCADHGCRDHEPGTWRTSKRLRGTLSEGQAIQELVAHAKEFPKSGPYRLAYHLTVHTTTTYTIEGSE